MSGSFNYTNIVLNEFWKGYRANLVIVKLHCKKC